MTNRIVKYLDPDPQPLIVLDDNTVEEILEILNAAGVNADSTTLPQLDAQAVRVQVIIETSATSQRDAIRLIALRVEEIGVKMTEAAWSIMRLSCGGCDNDG